MVQVKHASNTFLQMCPPTIFHVSVGMCAEKKWMNISYIYPHPTNTHMHTPILNVTMLLNIRSLRKKREKKYVKEKSLEHAITHIA